MKPQAMTLFYPTSEHLMIYGHIISNKDQQ